jgi:glycosyltransferase involved in cell wall biosynthesis
MKHPRISVIIPNYNYGRFLPEAIDSILNQTITVQEIIVVDDGSTDNSPEVLASYGNKIHVVFQQNRGVGAARNAGVKVSSGEFIAFLDADDIWHPTKLEKQLQYLIEDSENGLVTCGMREFDEKGRTIAEYNNTLKGKCANEFVLFKKSFIVSGSAVMLHRKIFEQVNGFDETKEMHPSEDWEFSYRVACVSKIVFVPQILVDYRNQGGNGHLKIPQFECAMLLAYDKIFRFADDETLKLRRQCYGNLFATLAGSYFQARNYSRFLKSTLKSLWYTPQNVNRYLTYPQRIWRRKFSGRNSLLNKQA